MSARSWECDVPRATLDHLEHELGEHDPRGFAIMAYPWICRAGGSTYRPIRGRRDDGARKHNQTRRPSDG